MKVGIKDLSVSMEVKNNGIELEVRDNDDKHQGDLVVTKSKLIWCEGKTNRDNGHQVSWKDFTAFMENKDAFIAFLKAQPKNSTAKVK